MSDPLISVVTAVHNGARFIGEAIASVRAQSISDWEYIIVDDASADETVEIVAAMSEEDPRLRLIRRNEIGGPYIAANDGLGVCTGRYIARIDADDLAPVDRFERQLAFLADNPELRACGGFYRTITQTGDAAPYIRRFPTSPGAVRWRLCLALDLPHSSAFVERAAFVELGGYRPLALAQDWRLWCELSRRCWLGIVPEVVAFRRVHSERLTDTSASMQARFASEVAQEHINALSGEMWTLDDVDLLRRAAHGQPEPLRDCIAVLDRWASLWDRDGRLTAAERELLRRWTRMTKLRDARVWGERQPVLGPIVRVGGSVIATSRRAGVSIREVLMRKGRRE